MTGPAMFKNLREEIDSIIARDPAARSRTEVALAYPGFHAVLLHRLANGLWRRDFRLLARFLSNIGRWVSGADIHPGATIGRRFFMDHASGIVIGETAEIGDDVTLYQNVTLGGVAPSVDSAAQVNRKRHPTIRSDVIIGSGAQVLGPIVVGEGARIGANAVVVKDVPAGVTMVGVAARQLPPKECRHDFMAYGTPTGELADPVARALESLTREVAALNRRVAELEAARAEVEQAESKPVEYAGPMS
ncbi:MAG TPA: serine O-acetyltransferase [Alphaproteobacteria bacterium]|nr:serine O-acetyltransferase [Alphaproteobacteria bacterium]